MKLSQLPEYWIIKDANQRCYNSKSHGFKNYGGRGIAVCERWRHGNPDYHLNFIEDMGLRPTPHHSLDRIDNDGDYSPENCRWADRTVQSINQRLKSSSTSGYRGVIWNQQHQKWFVRISYRGQRVFLGLFTNIEQAALAYNVAATALHGDDAKLNALPTAT